jgi:RNA polymerase sigma-70 factor (ECF subfamily)
LLRRGQALPHETLPHDRLPDDRAVPSVPTGGDPADEETARLREQLARAVKRVCPGWLADHADDIVQCAAVKLLERRSEGSGPLPPSYLWKVAYTATVDEIRRRRRRREVALDDGEDESATVAVAEGTVTDPERLQAAREIGRALRECLLRIVEARRLAVVLHLQGHTVPEAGRILGWGAKRVENLVYRGLADLRQCLSAKGIAP